VEEGREKMMRDEITYDPASIDNDKNADDDYFAPPLSLHPTSSTLMTNAFSASSGILPCIPGLMPALAARHVTQMEKAYELVKQAHDDLSSAYTKLCNLFDGAYDHFHSNKHTLTATQLTHPANSKDVTRNDQANNATPSSGSPLPSSSGHKKVKSGKGKGKGKGSGVTSGDGKNEEEQPLNTAMNIMRHIEQMEEIVQHSFDRHLVAWNEFQRRLKRSAIVAIQGDADSVMTSEFELIRRGQTLQDQNENKVSAVASASISYTAWLHLPLESTFHHWRSNHTDVDTLRQHFVEVMQLMRGRAPSTLTHKQVWMPAQVDHLTSDAETMTTITE